tara:strand:- start:2605 stop:3762 length:1158 start_codon:yes stop_codon:yes gene_type:complete
MDLNNELKDINRNLSEDGIKIRIESRGKYLNLRGPLPCRKQKGKLTLQRISLQLPANQEGLKESKKLLDLLLLQLEHNQFNWENWSKRLKTKEQVKNNSIHDEIKAFELAFFNDPKRNKSNTSNQTTWNSAYKPYLHRLQRIGTNKNSKITSNLFYETLSTYKEKSRSRQQCASSLAVFARYLNIRLNPNWKELGSGYGMHQSRFRELPSDQLIKETWELIPSKKWRMVYGLMATYGLRNHEVFFSDLSSLSSEGDKILRVLPNTKTGEHQVWPFHIEWFDYFELSKVSNCSNPLPSINTDLSHTSLQKVGRRVSEQFRRYNLPITPYDLRHAWAIRTIHIGLPDTVSARMMGHSVSIHTRTYHHWITKRDQQEAVDRALSRKID